MKMARATQRDFDQMARLSVILQCLCNRWEPTHPDTEVDVGEDDVPAVLGELVRDWYQREAGAWGRVVEGGEIAIKGACDPNLNYLEYRADILAAMKAAGIPTD